MCLVSYGSLEQGCGPWCGLFFATALALQGHFITLGPEAVADKNNRDPTFKQGSVALQHTVAAAALDGPEPATQLPQVQVVLYDPEAPLPFAAVLMQVSRELRAPESPSDMF